MKAIENWKDIISLNYPVTGATIYPTAIKVHRTQRQPLKGERPPRENHVTKLSHSSLNRLAFLVQTAEPIFVSIITLTYSTIPLDGKVVKKHLNTFLTRIRQLYLGVAYIWFLEFQRRGAPHFHILTDLVSTLPNRQLVARIWSKIISHNENERAKVYRVHAHKASFQAIIKPDGAKRYALKYALKPQQKQVPKQYRNVGRFWGNSRNCRPVGGITIDCNEDELRAWIALHNPKINDRLPDFLPTHLFRG